MTTRGRLGGKTASRGAGSTGSSPEPSISRDWYTTMRLCDRKISKLQSRLAVLYMFYDKTAHKALRADIDCLDALRKEARHHLKYPEEKWPK